MYCVFFHFHFFYKTCKTCQKVVVVKWKKKVRLNISILCKVTSLGTFKQLSSPVCPLYSFIERSRKKRGNRSMHIASSGEGINEITRIFGKKWLLAVAIEKLHFCLCTIVSTFVFPLLQLYATTIGKTRRNRSLLKTIVF